MRLDRGHLLVLTLVTALLSALSLTTNTLAKETDTNIPLGAVGGTVHADPFTGMATTSIPIEVPAGRNGVQPNLQLVYSSSNGNGWLGMGWKLELGSIERQTRFGVDYTKNDYTIQMSGVASELVQAPPPAPSDEYQAKLEGSFFRIKKRSGGGWEVTDKKGTKYLFGQTAASQAANPADATKIFKWHLERIEDRDGNFLTVTYSIDQGQVYLDHIDYTGNGSTAPTNQIKFYLESRPDAPPMYTGNYLIKAAKRLKTIEVKANGILVRVYSLNYIISQKTNNSLLTQLQQVGNDAQVNQSDGSITGGMSLPAVIIAYSGGSAIFSISSNGPVWSDANGWSAAQYYGTIQYPDVNGDGKADVCGRDAGGILCWLSNGTGFSTSITGPVWSDANGWSVPQYYGTIQYPDVNGDGKADVCGRDAGGILCWLSNGTGFPTSITGPGWSDANGWSAAQYYGTIRIRDTNGDGKADVCGRDAGGILCLKPTEDGIELLRTLANSLGGRTAITYTPSTQYANTQLPYPLQTVSSITTCDNWSGTSCAGISSTTTYAYSGGYHHIAEREFRGFNYAKVTGPTGPNGEQLITETWFHQGNDVVVGTNNPNVATGYTKGLPYRTKVTDATGRVWSDTTMAYIADADGVAPFFTPVAQVDSVIDNGAKQTRLVYPQYDAYGNVLREDQYGDLATTTDDRTVIRTFANNTTDWLIGFPLTETSYAGIGTTNQIAQTTLYYDGTTSCATASVNQSPTQGHVTRTVRWLNGGTSPETRMAYDAFGNLTCTRDALDNTSTVTYDASNTFAKTATNPLGHVTTTQYYGIDGVLMDKGLYGQVKSVTDPNNQTTISEYDALGRKIKTTAPDGLITTATYNYSTGFTVGTQHVLTSTTGAGLATALTSATYFDGLGRSIKKEATGPDGKTIVTEVQYDSRGAVRQKSLPYFKTLESVTGRWATTNYDALGRVVRMDSPDGTRGLACFTDWVTVTIDAADHRKRETKDVYGRTIRVDEYQGTFSTCSTEVGTPYATTTYQYDVQGNLLSVTDAKGNVSTMTYDTLGRKTAMHDPDMGNWSYVYDAAGNLTKQTDAKAQLLWFQYDALNRRVQKDFTTQKALGSGDVRYTYDGATNNRKGRLQQVVDASGTVVFQYDGLGRISQTDKALDGTTYTTQSTYDGLGRLLTVTYPSTPAKTISYAYNGPVLDRVFEGTTTYIQYTNHNALGQAGTTTYGNGVSTTTTYANANNMVCSQQNFRLCTLVTTAPGTGGGGGGGTSTTYNAQADFSSVQGQQGWYYLSSTGTQLTWNGNFWQGTDGYIGLWNDGGHPGSSTDAVRRWVAPSAGNVRITGNASHGETCGGDGTTVMIKKNGSLLWSQAVPAGTTVYSFDLSNTVAANDQIEFVTNKNTDIYCDNTIFTPTIVLTTGGGAGGTAYQDLRYVYGPNGNVSDIYDNTVAGGAGDQHLSYDSLDRLTLANGPYGTNGANASFTYTYDELGNLTLNSQVGTYSYPTSGASSVRPHAVTTAGSNSYSYDANGNLTSGAGRTLAYNLENKPLTITIAGQTTTFVYDGDGGRVKKTAGSTVTRYIGKLYECDNTSCSRVVFAGGQRIATIGASGAIYYYHSDHLGSSSVITDSAGTNVQSLTYFPYGATRTNNSSATPAIDVPYKYTGKELDSSTNLYYYEARYYDPTLGRFLSADTIVPNPRDPQDLNRYTYAGNNPLRYTDPTGHFKIKFNKFFKRAFGDVGTAVIGAVTQVYGPLLIPGCGPFCAFVAGGTILSQSKSGRYVLAGEIVAASVVASVACGGCGLAVGAAVGSTLGAGFGGYSAARNGGDISSGILFGAGVGAVTGAIQGAAWTVPFGPSLATGQTAAFFGSHIGAGALVGAGSGATVGYAGGAGNVDTILSGTARGAVVGAAVATILAGIDYAGGFAIDKISVKLPDFGSPPNPEVNHVIDLAKVFGGLSAKTVQALSESPLISGLAVSGASGGDVLTGGVLSNYALGELGKKGGHCTYGSEGVECGLGSKAK